MPQFQEPSIHRVVSMTATVTECNADATCLSLMMHGKGDPAEFEIYFHGPFVNMAQKYADAINAVRP